jgi:hypothetical protein
LEIVLGSSWQHPHFRVAKAGQTLAQIRRIAFQLTRGGPYASFAPNGRFQLEFVSLAGCGLIAA